MQHLNQNVMLFVSNVIRWHPQCPTMVLSHSRFLVDGGNHFWSFFHYILSPLFLTKGPLDPDLDENHTAFAHWLIPLLTRGNSVRMYVCVQPLQWCLINSLELSWCWPWSIPGLEYHPSHTQQCLRHGLLFLFVPHPFFWSLYYKSVSLKEPSFIMNFFIHGNSFLSFYFLHSSVFLHIILPLSLSLSLVHSFHSRSLFLCTYLLLMSRFHESVMQRGYSRICSVRGWITITVHAS